MPGFNDVPKLRLFFYLHTPVLTALFQRGSGRLRCRGNKVRDCGFDREQETSSLSVFPLPHRMPPRQMKLRRTTELYDDYDI